MFSEAVHMFLCAVVTTTGYFFLDVNHSPSWILIEIKTSKGTSISFQPLGRNMTWSSWSCCYPYVGRSDNYEFMQKTVSTFCPGHFSQELRNRLGIKKGTYWTRAWIYALLGFTSWKDAKTWWRCMSGTICWRSPEPAKCNTQCSWMCFLFYF